jgi:hypothetical protein
MGPLLLSDQTGFRKNTIFDQTKFHVIFHFKSIDKQILLNGAKSYPNPA